MAAFGGNSTAWRLDDGWKCILAFGPLGDTQIARWHVGANPDFANAPPPAREAEADDRDRATAYAFAGGD